MLIIPLNLPGNSEDLRKTFLKEQPLLDEGGIVVARTHLNGSLIIGCKGIFPQVLKAKWL